MGPDHRSRHTERGEFDPRPGIRRAWQLEEAQPTNLSESMCPRTLRPFDSALAAQTVTDLLVLGFEFKPRGLGLELQQRAEIDVFVAVADHALHDLASERC